MHILVSNDDGVDAPGIAALADAVSGLGEVHVVAPAVERSAVGHAITLFEPLWVHRVKRLGEDWATAVSGTPADCVKLAVQALLPEPPALVLSGINRGANTGINVIYSGTVSAATEGTILGIPSIAVSIASYSFGDYEAASWIVRTLAEDVLRNGLPTGTLLNVNVPPLPKNEIRGVRLTRQGHARFAESFDERRDPRDRVYFWMAGRRDDGPEPPGSDETAVRDGYISISPLHYDLTDWRALAALPERWSGLNVEVAPDLPAASEGP